MIKIVLLRHGESQWNAENRFSGWKDVGLTEKGLAEAKASGHLLKSEGYTFDLAYTSVLRRAIKTLWVALEEMDLMWIPVRQSWRLNERHYGALQGLDKAETAAKFGEAQVKIWRRSYAIPPPPLDESDERHPRHDPRYADLPPTVLPGTESLKTTLARVQPYWEDRIAAELLRGRNVLVAAHGNSLRAVVKMLEDISDEEITELNIPTGIPRLYELDADLRPTRAEYLGDAAAIAAAAEAVANQAKAKKK
jgi:2,3-bisphosphoglycerate-dependent phosphoglycerate mutase